MKRLLMALGLLVAAFLFARWYKNQRNDLTEHVKEQNELAEIGNVSTSISNLSLDRWPLTTVGRTPLSEFDFANWQFGSDQSPGPMELYPSALGSLQDDPVDFISSIKKGFWN